MTRCTREEQVSWNRLKKRFPEIERQVEHFAARMAAEHSSKTNVLIDIRKESGGYQAELTVYHRLCTGGQTFSLHDPQNHSTPDEYPEFFESIEDAAAAAVREMGELYRAVEGAQK